MYMLYLTQSCITPAKMLSSKVNSRDPVIVTDAELSIVKVAQLERVFYYQEAAPPTIQSLVSRRSAAWRIHPSWHSTYSLCLMLFILVWLPDIHHGDQPKRGSASDREDGMHTQSLRIYAKCDMTMVASSRTCYKHDITEPLFINTALGQDSS